MIEARFLGPDPAVLDSLAGEAIEIMRRNPKVADARNEWGNMSMVMRPVYDPVKAGALGITKFTDDGVCEIDQRRNQGRCLSQ